MSWRESQEWLREGGLAVWHRAEQFKFRYTIRSLLLTTTTAAVFCGVLVTVNPLAARIAGLLLLAAGGLHAAARNDGNGFGSLRGPAFHGALGGALTGLLISAVAWVLNRLWVCGLCNGEHVLYMVYWWTSAGAVLGGIIGCLVAALRPKPETSSRCRVAVLPPIRLPAQDSFTTSRTPGSPVGWRDGVSGVYVSLFVHVSLVLLSGTAFYGWGRTTFESTKRVELIVALSQETGSLSDDPFTTIDDLREELFVEQQLQPKKPQLMLAELDAEPLPSDVTYPGDLEDDAMKGRTVPFAPTLSELDPDEHRVTTGTSAQDRSHGRPSRYSVRTRGNRAAALKRGGGTALSEDAIARALQWLARHQNRDGSWSWAYTPNDRCSGFANPGESTGKMGATGLALLAFLGAGYVHKPSPDFENTYEQHVRGGVDYLCDNMIVENRAARLFEANGSSHAHMYCHGIAACAIVEAYGATLDPDLRRPAQLALNYIVQAQHPENGGWLYTPRAGGDTSVVGWQVMALKSGVLSGLDVPNRVKLLANKWLDLVQWGVPKDGNGYGAFYGYRRTSDRPEASATTAIGLLCRTYLGARKDDPGLAAGAAALVAAGPSEGNMYHDYYTTLALYQICRPESRNWQRWNLAMRDRLIRSQVSIGEDRGSWYFTNGHGGKNGGRVYCTAMAAMTLEIYYRYPLVHGEQ